MTIKNPYQPPAYGVTNKAIERTAAGEPPASEVDAEDGEKEAPKPLNKMASKPANKGNK